MRQERTLCGCSHAAWLDCGEPTGGHDPHGSILRCRRQLGHGGDHDPTGPPPCDDPDCLY